MPHSILLVEDDQALARTTSAYLTSQGFDVAVLQEGTGVVERVWQSPPDLLILDVELPGESGLSICSRVRERFEGPILMLTGRDQEMDEIMGFEFGADDYVAKPVMPRRLKLRVDALLRRSGPGRSSGAATVHEDRDLVVDESARSVRVQREALELTTAEFDLLWLLVQNIGTPVTREQYYDELRGIRYDGLDRAMDTKMSALRKKLVDAGLPADRIKTVRGMGYQLTRIR